MADLDAIVGCTTAPWPTADAERCCGFGGTFSTKLPETATAMADAKLASLRGLSADERRLVIEYFRRLNGDKP